MVFPAPAALGALLHISPVFWGEPVLFLCLVVCHGAAPGWVWEVQLFSAVGNSCQRLGWVHARVVARPVRSRPSAPPVPTSSESAAAPRASPAGGSAHPPQQHPGTTAGAETSLLTAGPLLLPARSSTRAGRGPAPQVSLWLQPTVTPLLGFCCESLLHTRGWRDGVCRPAVPRRWQENVLLRLLSIARPPVCPSLAFRGHRVHGAPLRHPWAQALPVLPSWMETLVPGTGFALPSGAQGAAEAIASLLQLSRLSRTVPGMGHLGHLPLGQLSDTPSSEQPGVRCVPWGRDRRGYGDTQGRCRAGGVGGAGRSPPPSFLPVAGSRGPPWVTAGTPPPPPGWRTRPPAVPPDGAVPCGSRGDNGGGGGGTDPPRAPPRRRNPAGVNR